jgi:hypothetical protein
MNTVIGFYHHKWDQALRFPQYGAGWVFWSARDKDFAKRPMLKFIREFCCEPQIVGVNI